MNTKQFVKELANSWTHSKLVLLGNQYWYGHLEILASQLNLKGTRLLKGPLQHGWTYSSLSISNVRNHFGQALPKHVWSERIYADASKHRGLLDFKPILIGAPWCYFLSANGFKKTTLGLRKTDEFNDEGGITTYFPSHSILDFHLSREALIEGIEEVPGENVEVCLGWIDFLDPIKRNIFVSRGMKVICMGYRGNAGNEAPMARVGGRVEFLSRLLTQMEKSEILVFDEMSSAFWYGLSLGKKVVLRDKSAIYQEYSRRSGVDVNQFPTFDMVQQLTGLGVFETGEVVMPSRQQIEAALKELGWEVSQTLLDKVPQLKTISV